MCPILQICIEMNDKSVIGTYSVNDREQGFAGHVFIKLLFLLSNTSTIQLFLKYLGDGLMQGCADGGMGCHAP